MTRSKLLLAVAALILAAAAPLTAQIPDSISMGARLRITDAQGRTTMGSFVAKAPDGTVVLRNEWHGNVWTDSIPAEDVRRIEVGGRHRHVLKHLAVTTAVSTGAFAVLVAAAWEPCRCTEFLCCAFTPESRGQAFEWGAVIGGVLGVPVGLILGIAIRHETWRDVGVGTETVTKPALRFAPTPDGGFSLGASVPLGRFP